jgi:hypothetical protein
MLTIGYCLPTNGLCLLLPFMLTKDSIMAHMRSLRYYHDQVGANGIVKHPMVGGVLG